ncbi:MAG: tetratricopeptide repeat protein [Candidatus Eisenbacteria bacterium]
MPCPRLLHLAPLSFALMAAAAIAVAAPSPPRHEPSQQSTSNHPAATGEKPASESRALAELSYKKGYKDAQEAKKLKKSGKTAQATEKFAKALTRFEEAVQLHEPYAEAWNMIGYCSRNVGDLRRAFDAYDRSLAIDPDYEEAHEYLGEAYVMSGNLEKAREQLAWLEAKKSGEAKELAEAIEAAEKENAASKGVAASGGEAAPAAPADSAAADSASAH